MKVRCLIVDDEPIARDILEAYLQRIGQLELVKACQNALEALEVIQREAVDLMFLDIQMPGLNGMDFMKTLTHPPAIILTTAYRDYAVESYELQALDYLLKPIPFERFLNAVNKYFQLHQPEASSSSAAAPLTSPEGYIYLSVDKRMVRINLSDILYIESQRDAILIYTEQGEELLVHKNISFAEQKLPSDGFLRIHRSFIVAIPHIKAYTATMVVVNGKELPIGRNYKQEVADVLKAISNTW